MSSIPDKIHSILQPITEELNVYIVEVVLRGERTSKVIEVYVDSDSGITLDQCSDISRKLSEKLDELDLITGRYRLDVSSPGLDRSLKLLRQYQKNIGRNCKIKYKENVTTVTQEGNLESVSENSITIKKNGKAKEILFSTISETVIIPKIK
ncbi:MAG: ribosome maturation factor RimP [Bacteroidota bacterium]|nr:ribosome maturation factor RimP [Bacteroidota bacterium]